MKNFLLLIIVCNVTVFNSIQSQELNRIWATEAILEVPESVLYSAIHNCLFVSNIAGDPSDKDGKGMISVMDITGKVNDLHWVTGLSAPKGMAADSMYLYVSDINELVVIDIELKQIHNRIKREDAQFLNDVAVNSHGDVFVSDSNGKRIYKLKGGVLKVWLEGEMLVGVNGLFCEGDDIIVGTSSSILKVSMVDQSYEELFSETKDIDGIESDGEGGYYFSSWKGLLYHAVPGQQPVLLMDTTGESINCADIGYEPESKLIFVPTFFDNRVVAYRWGKL
ncbi:SMP-30/gluconolactonase/LRE family protein [Carboxylicivirga linearis]|uniref:ATP-binding protein n=1 Tax=Carboxylicivirga linearis TaxID=1628157 RepID=A0ABS5JZB4_9BACT|nr:hypothetical protein [Carboxylicivirga linearis]MBS2100238.1 hypothetical protein [Carboxylicivirga linearis]